MVFHHWESNFTPKENDFTLFCQPNSVKLKIEENSFPGKRFTPTKRSLGVDKLTMIYHDTLYIEVIHVLHVNVSNYPNNLTTGVSKSSLVE